MGGCCAPGALGPTSNAIQDGRSSEESESGLTNNMEGTSIVDRGTHGVLEREMENRQDMHVEELLRVLEVAVQKEYVGLTVSPEAGNGCSDRHQHRRNTGSPHSSSPESPTSVYSAAGSVFSRSSSNTYKEKSPQQNSPGARESYSFEKGKVSSIEGYRAPKGSFDWKERVEAKLDSMPRMQKEDLCSELHSGHSGPIDENFDKISQQITLDRQEKSSPPSTRPCHPEVLSEADDYPRGSSDTNSEEAERDKKFVCSTPVVKKTSGSFHLSRAASFISLGTVQCHPTEKLAVRTNQVREGSMRAGETYSTTDPARESPLQTDGAFPCFKTDQASRGSIVADDSYANWLERHSKELGWNSDSKFRSTDDLDDYEVYPKDHCEFNVVHERLAGSGSNCISSQVGQEAQTMDTGLFTDGFPKEGPSSCVQNVESEAGFESNCTMSWTNQGLCEHISEYFSFQPGQYAKGSFKFTPDGDPMDNPCSKLSLAKSTSCVALENNSDNHQGRARADLSEWTTTELGRSYEAFHNTSKTTMARHHLDYGGAKSLATSHVSLETPSSGSSGGSRSSKLNSRVETPKSVLSGGSSLATNGNHREKVKVCVRMRPFNDHEKVCPLRQLLCVMGEKVIVKEYDKPALRRSMDYTETDMTEFKVDYVLDDSYMQKHLIEKKEESQRRMYESIGLPCLDYALDGYNTTILSCGQVGTGKTHTMLGDGTEEGRGLMPRLGKELMHQLNKDFKDEFAVQVSYLEIYQERVRDLLAAQKVELQTSRCGTGRSSAAGWFVTSDDSVYNESLDNDTSSIASFSMGTPRSWRSERIPSVYFDHPVQKNEYLKVREHPVTGPYVEGLLWKDVTTWEDLETLMLEGAANRTSAAIPLNKFSSRGHTLFTIKLIRGTRRFVHGCPTSDFSLINLVDLAGTEKPQYSRKTSFERQDECRYINRSLAQLNDVILNLARNNKFVSYRGSALTWLLRESLGGNSKLFLIANISPAEQDFQESVNTLRYAAKANRIHSVITSHPDHKKQLLVSMKKEIQVLHDLVHDLTKNKLAECVKEEIRRARLPILSSLSVPRLEIPANRSVH